MKIKLKPYLRLLRIRDWRAYFLMAVMGFIIGEGYFSSGAEIVVFWTVTFLILGFGFSINDCFDTIEDQHTLGRKNPISEKEISFKEGFTFSILLAVLALVLSAYFDPLIFSFCFLGIITTFFYSAPPVRAKSRPLLGLFFHGFFAGVFFVALPILIFTKTATLFHYLIAGAVFYASITLDLRNYLEDYESDKKANLRTFACVVGFERSQKVLKYLTLLYPVVFIPLFLWIAPIYFILFLISSFIFVILFLSRQDWAIVKNYKLMDAYSAVSFGLVLFANLINIYGG